MNKLTPKLGALRGATISCRSVAEATSRYRQALGFEVVEKGQVSPELAASWNARAVAGAEFSVLSPPARRDSFLRFVADPQARPAKPYSTLGWAALEFTVKSSDRAIESLARHGFTVIGPAQDLEFSKGALRAGQVNGELGEILYVTQINAQIADFTLPTSSSLVGQMFIVIACVPGVDAAYESYRQQLGTIAKEPFQAQVPFMADFHGIAREHSYYIGCVECVPESYIELDEMPAGIGPRACAEGRLPAGIAMISFDVPSLEPFRARARGPSLQARGAESLTIAGPYGEWIEVIERH